MSKIILTTPEPQTTEYAVAGIELYLDEGRETGRLAVILRSNLGSYIREDETGTEAANTIRKLNIANLSVKSLEARAIEWVQSRRPELAGEII